MLNRGQMHPTRRRILAAAAFVGIFVLACNLPKPAEPTPDTSGTAAAQTLAALETGDALTQAAAFTSSVSTPALLATPPADSTATAATKPPLDSVASQDALCWVGPGSQYVVVSAIRNGMRVQLLGTDAIPGWYIVRNPIYHDPCWISSDALKVDPGVNLSALPVFGPPATPTPTATKTPKPTATTAPPSATSTP
jgi:uncharacterized protein YgiM (DUF1202 family)